MSEPLTVLLSALDAATLPLDGTELVFVMQGGEPKRTTQAAIAAPTQGTYTPTLTDTTGQLTVTTRSPAARVRHSPADAGIVQAFLPLTMSGTLDGSTPPNITVTLPVLPDEAGTFCVLGTDAVTGMTADVTALGMTLEFSTPPGGAGAFGPVALDLHVIYQAAAAA